MKKLYPVMDALNWAERNALGFTSKESSQPLQSLGIVCPNVHAILTGEKRAPKKGEWYLSGAIVGAYRAFNDMTDKRQIVRLVKTKTETITRVVIV